MEEHRRSEDSLAPIAVENTSLEHEAALFHRDRLWSLLRIATLSGVTAFAAVTAVDAMEAAEVREQARISLGAVHHDHFDAFLQCALPDTLPERVTDRESLLAAFERNANREGDAYGTLLQGCTDRLAELSAGIQDVAVPDEGLSQRALMAELAHQILFDFRAYVDHLQSPRAADYVRSLALADRVASDCLAYEAARQRLWRVVLD